MVAPAGRWSSIPWLHGRVGLTRRCLHVAGVDAGSSLSGRRVFPARRCAWRGRSRGSGVVCLAAPDPLPAGRTLLASGPGTRLHLLGSAGVWLGGDHPARGFGAESRASPVRVLFDRDLAKRTARDEPVVIEGRLREDAALTGYGASLRIDVTRVGSPDALQPAFRGVRLAVGGTFVRGHVAQWTAGRTILAPVRLRRPLRYLNPGVPDQERLLARRGIVLLGSVKSAALVDVVRRGGWIAERTAKARAFARRSIRGSVGPFDPRSAAITVAILIGDRAGLDAKTTRGLQETGTYHVIAISGGNIAIAAGIVLGLMRLAGLSPRSSAVRRLRHTPASLAVARRSCARLSWR